MCIVNTSRMIVFSDCEAKEYFQSVRGLAPPEIATPLIYGGAYHKGSASYFADKDLEKALKVAEEDYRRRINWKELLPEEVTLHERNITFIKRSIETYAEQYQDEVFVVLMPEVEFCVPFPNTEHHCYFVHKILHPEDRGDGSTCSDPRCYIPHYLKGKTDAVLAWRSMVWLLEQKTSAVSGDVFWSKWALDVQPTAYIWGISKATKVRPNGFVLNLIKKPRKNARDPFHIEFEREAYLRTDADLLRVERELAVMAARYEHMVATGEYLHTGLMHGGCVKWNRKCQYHAVCVRGNDQVLAGEFGPRDPDYVDAEYYKLLGMEVPAHIQAGVDKREGKSLDADT